MISWNVGGQETRRETPLRKFGRFFIIFDYYLAALLLLWAGISKLTTPAVGDLLETLLEHEVLTIDQLVFIARWFPPLEITLAMLALSGVSAILFARFMASLYLLFTLVIVYVSEGYLTLPIDCGCFGDGGQTPAYLLIIRNTVIALPLFFFPKSIGYSKKPQFLFRITASEQ